VALSLRKQKNRYPATPEHAILARYASPSDADQDAIDDESAFPAPAASPTDRTPNDRAIY
jgi:hypothetical protein